MIWRAYLQRTQYSLKGIIDLNACEPCRRIATPRESAIAAGSTNLVHRIEGAITITVELGISELEDALAGVPDADLEARHVAPTEQAIQRLDQSASTLSPLPSLMTPGLSGNRWPDLFVYLAA